MNISYEKSKLLKDIETKYPRTNKNRFTRAEANLCRYNCLPESKWDKLKTPIIVKGHGPPM